MTEKMFVTGLVYFPELINPNLSRYLNCFGKIPKQATTKYYCTTTVFIIMSVPIYVKVRIHYNEINIIQNSSSLPSATCDK